MIALSAGSLYSYGLNRAFLLAAETGFDGVEIIIDERFDTRQPDYLKRLSAEFGLAILSIHAPFAPDLFGWEKGRVSGIEETIKLAESVGARTVVLHLPLWFEKDYAVWLKEQLPHARDRSTVTIAVENLPKTYLLPPFFPSNWRHWRFQPTRLKDEGKSWLIPLVRRFGKEVFRFNELSELEKLAPLALDTTHLATGGYDILDTYRRLRDKIAHIHLSNYDKREHALPQKGVLPISDLLTQLRRDEFRGVVALELNPQSVEAVSEKKVKKNLRESLDFCRQYFG